jgi:hypothetical protein
MRWCSMRGRAATGRALGRLVAWISVLILGLLFHGAARAEPRIALVVGNGSYEQVQPLDNPMLDAHLMATTLATVGFDVTLLIDSDQNRMKQAVANFGRKLRAAGPDAVGLFYYAGHGVQSDGVNYLLPVDSAVRDEADLDLVGVQADWVLRQLFSARNRTNIVILDACRNNPFEAIAGMRQQGLAEMNAPPGTIIAYSSAPGAVALDGAPGTNSPFTGALSAGILAEGEPIEQVFKDVRVSVVEQTQGRQTPWDSSSLTSEFYFDPPDPVDPREVAAAQLWDTVKQSGDSVQIILFLRQYPDTKVSEEARAMLQQSLATVMGPAGTAAADTGVPSAPALKLAPPVAAAPSPPAAPSPAPAPAVAAAAPPLSDEESELIGRAQSTGAVKDYQAYLEAYPSGVFAALADAEIRALQLKGQPTTPAAVPALDLTAPSPAATAPAPAQPPATPAQQQITFLSPLAGTGPIEGRSIAQIIEGSPQYPPVEGLPESFWKTKTCSNCHHWNQSALCEQGKTYLTQTGEFALGKQHPIDGFKQVLRDWASEGCG